MVLFLLLIPFILTTYKDENAKKNIHFPIMRHAFASTD